MSKPLTIPVLLLVTALLAASGVDTKGSPGVYAATVVLNQGAEPTVTELQNSTGAVITITRNAAGQYRITSDPPVFTVGRTLYYTHYYVMGPSATVRASMRCWRADYCDLRMFIADDQGNSGYFYDGGTTGLAIPVKIEVYP